MRINENEQNMLSLFVSFLVKLLLAFRLKSEKQSTNWFGDRTNDEVISVKEKKLVIFKERKERRKKKKKGGRGGEILHLSSAGSMTA